MLREKTASKDNLATSLRLPQPGPELQSAEIDYAAAVSSRKAAAARKTQLLNAISVDRMLKREQANSAAAVAAAEDELRTLAEAENRAKVTRDRLLREYQDSARNELAKPAEALTLETLKKLSELEDLLQLGATLRGAELAAGITLDQKTTIGAAQLMQFLKPLRRTLESWR